MIININYNSGRTRSEENVIAHVISCLTASNNEIGTNPIKKGDN